jgi:hypothetical protein
MRPKEALPLKVLAFDGQAAIGETYAIGQAAGDAGFTPFPTSF